MAKTTPRVADAPPDIMDTLNVLSGQLRDWKEKKAQLEAELKTVNAKISELEIGKIPQVMTDGEIENVRFQGIGTVYLETRVHVSVLAQDMPAFISFLKQRGDADIIKETVHWKTLASWGKEILEKNEPLPEYCKVFYQPTARIRKS